MITIKRTRHAELFIKKHRRGFFLSCCALSLVCWTSFQYPVYSSPTVITVPSHAPQLLENNIPFKNKTFLCPELIAPHPVPVNIILKKASILSADARIPADPTLLTQGYVCLYSGSDNFHARELYTWLLALTRYGIHAKMISQTDRQLVYVRFSEKEELITAYENVYAAISAVTPFDASIINHMIFKESRNREQAVSPAGAIGLTQIMPFVVSDLLKEKASAGTHIQSTLTIASLTEEVCRLQEALSQETSSLAIAQLSRALADKIFHLNKRIILSLIPDVLLSPPALMHTPYIVSNRERAQFHFSGYTIARIPYLVLTHGPLNVCFGMAHLAMQYNTFEYYKAVGKIDANTESLLAAQLAYNCGQTRMINRINSLGGWNNVFDVPPYRQGKRPPYLPQETAHYGYQFLQSYISLQASRGGTYYAHPEALLHYKLCLSALRRSKTFRCVVETLKEKNLSSLSYLLTASLDNTIRKANTGTLNSYDIKALQTLIASLPSWPLVKEIAYYLDVLTTTAVFS